MSIIVENSSLFLNEISTTSEITVFPIFSENNLSLGSVSSSGTIETDPSILGESYFSNFFLDSNLETDVSFWPSSYYFNLDTQGIIAFLCSVSGNSNISEIQTEGFIALKNYISGDTIFSDIKSYPNVYFESNELNLNEIETNNSNIEVITFVKSEKNIGEIDSNSVIDRGEKIGNRYLFREKIICNGEILVIPTVLPTELSISGNIHSENEQIVVCIFVSAPEKTTWSTEIQHLRGRVIFGYPQPDIIRQVYEMSNNRSLEIPEIPEDPSYAVFLPTTDYDLNDKELRRGTVDLNFSFTHDVIDIKQISVWQKTPEGLSFIDRMRTFDIPGKTHEPHILFEPFRYTQTTRVPLHCISNRKQNQFFAKIEYKQPGELLSGRERLQEKPRAMRERESYIINFQAHFDNRLPFLNIADHSFSDGSSGTKNPFGEINFFPLEREYITEDDNNKTGLGSNNNIFFEENYYLLTKTFLVKEDIRTVCLGSNDNIYFKQEYVENTWIQIGG